MIIFREDKEFLVLSSQPSSDTAIILNTWTSSETSHSFNFPYTPPHIKDTLNESQMQGMCLDPYLRDRFELSNIGTLIIQNDTQNIFLYRQNSIGMYIVLLLLISHLGFKSININIYHRRHILSMHNTRCRVRQVFTYQW